LPDNLPSFRREIVKDKMLSYLDDLRESGETNMFGARPFLQEEFLELDRKQTGGVLTYWMETFEARHT